MPKKDQSKASQIMNAIAAEASKSSLGENDFTQPGEAIPQEGGVKNFVKYNVAHFDPSSPENAAGMALGAGSIENVAPKFAKLWTERMLSRAAGQEVPSSPSSLIGSHVEHANGPAQITDAYNQAGQDFVRVTDTGTGRGSTMSLDDLMHL